MITSGSIEFSANYANMLCLCCIQIDNLRNGEIIAGSSDLNSIRYVEVYLNRKLLLIEQNSGDRSQCFLWRNTYTMSLVLNHRKQVCQTHGKYGALLILKKIFIILYL